MPRAEFPTSLPMRTITLVDYVAEGVTETLLAGTLEVSSTPVGNLPDRG